MGDAATVLVTTRSFGSGRADPVAFLQDAGCEVVRGDPHHRLDRLGDALGRARAWIAGTGPVTRAHLEHAERLMIVARYGVGVDAVDQGALRRRGIVLTNTPGANTEAVADHTIGLVLAALRSTLAGDTAVRAGTAAPASGRELGNCTVGLIGYGNIGRAVHRRLASFRATVVAHDPYVEPARSDGIDLVQLEELAARANVVSLHAPPSHRPIVDAAFIDALPSGAVIVNTARAELIDEAALAAALSDGRVAAAALDVISAEFETDSPLLTSPNVTLTPHIGGRTVEAVDRMGMAAAEEVVRVVVRGEAPRFAVPLDTGSKATS